MRNPLTDFIRARRAIIAASASRCERCSSVCTATCRQEAQRDHIRFDPHRAQFFR